MTLITEARYKDIFAVKVETEALTALFLPYNGGKLASLTDRADGSELLETAKGEKYLPLDRDGSFVDSECSAFDDMFPTVDPYTPNTGSRAGKPYPDHGEISRSRLNYSIGGGSLTMTYESKELFYRYTKTIAGGENGSLRITCRIDNLADDGFEFLWAGHCMIAAEEGGRVITPYAEGTPAEIMFDDFERYGKKGDIVAAVSKMLVSQPFSPSGDAYKIYFNAPIPEGWLKYVNPRTKRALVFEYDREKLPYIGLWMNNGHFKGMYSVAPELANIGYDSPDKAAAHGQKAVIAPHGSFDFTIKLRTEPISCNRN